MNFLRRYKEWGYTGDDKVVEKRTVRINTLKTKKLPGRFHLKKIPFLSNGFEVGADFSLASSVEYLSGEFYIQDASTQLAAEVLDPQPGERVLDMAAAPGGKTTHIAQIMNNEGVLVAVDAHHVRLQKLKNNLERCGVKNCVVYHKDGRFVDDIGLTFDRVLLDVPCSGNFSLDPIWLEKRTFEEVQQNAKLQKQLLAAAIKVCNQGGVVVYSTCSLEKEENEDIIEWALEQFGVELLPINKGVGVSGLTDKTTLCKRIWPGEMQGFFLAKMKKK